MSGIMTAIVGTVTASNIVYGDGLYNTTTGVDLSPITASASDTSISRTWIGYFTPASSGTIQLSLQTTALAGSFGGEASTTGQLWFGSGAISGSGSADITAFDNQTSSANFPMTQGVYYPIRIRWDGSYQDGFFGANSSGSITFLAAGSSNVTNRIFYNTVTNGF
jgi:hypothetical protein